MGCTNSKKKLLKDLHHKYDLGDLQRLEGLFQHHSFNGDRKSMSKEGLIRALEFPARMDSALSTRLFATFAAEGGAHAAKLAKQHHRINFDQFARGMAVISAGVPVEKWKFAFKMFDSDLDGRLSRAEFAEMLGYFCVPVAEGANSFDSSSVVDDPIVADAAIDEITQEAAQAAASRRDAVGATDRGAGVDDVCVNVSEFMAVMMSLASSQEVDVTWNAQQPIPRRPADTGAVPPSTSVSRPQALAPQNRNAQTERDGTSERASTPGVGGTQRMEDVHSGQRGGLGDPEGDSPRTVSHHRDAVANG